MEITNKTIGISSSDVAKCEDIDKLIEWAALVDGDIVRISLPIEKAKAEFLSSGQYADPKWFASANSAKRLQGVLKNQIQSRISALRTQKREQQKPISDAFMSAAREYLSKEDFRLIYERAKLMQ